MSSTCHHTLTHARIYVVIQLEQETPYESTLNKKTDENVPDDVDGEPSRTTNKSDLDKPVDEDDVDDEENERNEESESEVSFRILCC